MNATCESGDYIGYSSMPGHNDQILFYDPWQQRLELVLEASLRRGFLPHSALFASSTTPLICLKADKFACANVPTWNNSVEIYIKRMCVGKEHSLGITEEDTLTFVTVEEQKAGKDYFSTLHLNKLPLSWNLKRRMPGTIGEKARRMLIGRLPSDAIIVGGTVKGGVWKCRSGG
jgi:hypothetical protein